MKMKMNDLDIYYECGQKAGRAATRQDWSLVRFQQSWLKSALSLEAPEYRAQAHDEYQKGYKEGRGVYAVTYY
jgi:hypothetical protein